jgi:hypothetical protein
VPIMDPIGEQFRTVPSTLSLLFERLGWAIIVQLCNVGASAAGKTSSFQQGPQTLMLQPLLLHYYVHTVHISIYTALMANILVSILAP